MELTKEQQDTVQDFIKDAYKVLQQQEKDNLSSKNPDGFIGWDIVRRAGVLRWLYGRTTN